ncbi:MULTISPECIES: alpha-N-arabinofuranosidase [unclassified Curtobacterium]|uniref:arabinosylfuranosidase ArfA n=1 Tax=unclassified Curtobacterium TaxID=257496 RepID=UPI000DA72A4C|nr:MULTISPECIES: alpha-N-arabinofuranosidase [unclassified Curtobacterium]PZE23721.1 alpha-L-arabinofuranosidase [Curtobacterium sp. MCBD17_028]WIB63795.1 alpha-N-arabinofuranosidase [Curtobacterium sp. MCBD17_040]WIB67636.1 alpha-N-arabinofuranosidase [Curtobacterium sp. MCBD17_035]
MPRVHLSLDPAFTIGPVRRRLFGGFVEHLGRHVYDGIHEPNHPTADEQGFRQDVIELVKELGVTTIRYPGGNFVSGYNWEDGVGPVDQRPRRLDLAWHATETNQVGLHEFSHWLDQVGSDLMLAVNLGTRGTKEAIELLEYTNVPGGTTRSEERKANGRERPFDVRMWCLGNEMDGPWQLGHRNAVDYGKLASRTAKAMRQIDPDIDLVACGSSGRGMPTFGAWEREVLEQTYDDVDYISCHAYYEEKDGDLVSFLSSGIDMDQFIRSVVETADHVKAARKSDKTIEISFDEWNVWYITDWEAQQKTYTIDEWPIAPRQLEDIYSVADAVAFGGLMITLLNHADRVASASLAQLVNVIAPIMTEPNGPAWRQTTFFPFSLTSQLAQGQALKVAIDGDTIDTPVYGAVPVVDAAATTDGERTSVFLINRSTDAATTVTLDLGRLGTSATGSVSAQGIWDDDVYAKNTLEDTERVGLRTNDTATFEDGTLTIELPATSWTAVTIG